MIRLELRDLSACLFTKKVFTLLLIAAAGFALFVNHEISGIKSALSHKDVRLSGRDTRSEMAEVTGPSVSGPPKTVVLTTTNSGYIDSAENWLASIEKCGVRPNVTIIAEDNGAYKKLTTRKYSFEVRVLRAEELSPTRRMIQYTEAFFHLVNKRASYILALLEEGYDVFFTDVDTFFPYFQGDYDAWFGLDFMTPQKRPCAGLAFWRCTNASMDALQAWIQIQETRKHTIMDQWMLTWVLERGFVKDFKWKGLEPDKFVNGYSYFHDAWRLQNPQVKPVILHNNWNTGHDYKVARFQHLGLWLIDYSNVDEDKTLEVLSKLKRWPTMAEQLAEYFDRDVFGSQHPEGKWTVYDFPDPKFRK